MSRSFQSWLRSVAALVCLLGCAAAAQGPPSGFLYHSPEFRFRVTLPGRDPAISQKGDKYPITIFDSSARDNSYSMKVVVYQLDARTAHQEFPDYFHEFSDGMKQVGTSLTGCQQGAVSNAPAERCVVSNIDGIGLMLLVRRGGVAYYVAGVQDRARTNEPQIQAALGSFLLLPEQEPYSFVAHGFRANFPDRPRLTESASGGVIAQAFATNARYMTMVAIDDLSAAQRALDPAHLFAAIERQDEAALQGVHLRLSECAPVSFQGGLPAHFCTYDDDKFTGKLLLVRRGDKMYSVLAHQPRGNGSDAELEQFVHSFEFLK